MTDQYVLMTDNSICATKRVIYLPGIHSRMPTVKPSHHVLLFAKLLCSQHLASLCSSICGSQQHQDRMLNNGAESLRVLICIGGHPNRAHLHHCDAVTRCHGHAGAPRHVCAWLCVRPDNGVVLGHVHHVRDLNFVSRREPLQNVPLSHNTQHDTVSTAHPDHSCTGSDMPASGCTTLTHICLRCWHAGTQTCNFPFATQQTRLHIRMNACASATYDPPSVYGYSGYIFRFCNTKTR